MPHTKVFSMAFCLVFGWRVFAQSPTESAKQLSSASSQVDAQRKLSSSPTIHAASAIARYYRVICLVHLNGKGTAEDPFRPEYAPDESLPPDRMGILGWSM